MNRKIAFLFPRPPSEHDFHRFQMKKLALSHEVLVIDLSPAFGRGEARNNLRLLGGGVRIERAGRLSDVEHLLSSEAPPTVAVDLLTQSRFRDCVRLLLRNSSTVLVGHAIGKIPQLERSPFWAKVMNHRIPSPPSVINAGKRLGQFVNQPQSIELSFYIAGGELSKKSGDALKASKVIDSRSLDCDEYDFASPLTHKANYGVLVDSGGPLHPDYQLLGVRSPLSPSEYFARLRKAIDSILEGSGQELFICPHPRVPLTQYSRWLPGVSLLPGSTASAIKACDFVVDIGSTATSFSVLAEKPISYLSLGQSRHSVEARLVQAFSMELGRPVLQYDSMISRSALLQAPDAGKYQAYKRNFLCGQFSSTLSFADQILSLSPPR